MVRFCLINPTLHGSIPNRAFLVSFDMNIHQLIDLRDRARVAMNDAYQPFAIQQLVELYAAAVMAVHWSGNELLFPAAFQRLEDACGQPEVTAAFGNANPITTSYVVIHRDIIINQTLECLSFCLNYFGYLPSEFGQDLAEKAWKANLLTVKGTLRGKFRTKEAVLRRLMAV